MADEPLPQFAEDNDLARARVFWRENGKPIVFGVVLGLAGILGYNYWQNHQVSTGEMASSLFDQVHSEGDTDDAMIAGKALKENHPDTVYAILGAFSLAKTFVEEDRYDAAEAELEWALDNTEDEALQHIARTRLASILLAQGKPDDVLDLIAAQTEAWFTGRYAELRGDALIMRDGEGDRDKAREAYRQSLDGAAEGGSIDRVLLELKLDALGPGDAL